MTGISRWCPITPLAAAVLFGACTYRIQHSGGTDDRTGLNGWTGVHAAWGSTTGTRCESPSTGGPEENTNHDPT
jgi:hypothetical protein